MSPSLAMVLWMGAVSAVLRAGGGGVAYLGAVLGCLLAAAVEAGLLETNSPRTGLWRRVAMTASLAVFLFAVVLDLVAEARRVTSG